jgi:hypothetical protein
MYCADSAARLSASDGGAVGMAGCVRIVRVRVMTSESIIVPLAKTNLSVTA